MGIYLGDKKIQLQLAPQIKGTKQDKQSWTDGTAPAYTSNNNLFYFFEGSLLVNYPELYWGITSNMTQHTLPSDNMRKCKFYNLADDTSEEQEYRFYIIQEVHPTASGFYKINANLSSYYGSEVDYTESKDEEGNTQVEFNVWVSYPYNFFSVDPLTQELPVFYVSIDNMDAKRTNVIDTWNYLVAGKTYYIMAVSQYTWEGSGVEHLQAFVTITYLDYPRSSEDQISANNAAASMQTTITSLNTQGQNLVTKHNTLVDKYNNIISQWGTNKE